MNQTHLEKVRTLETKIGEQQQTIQLLNATVKEGDYWMNNPVQMSEDHKRLRDENNQLISMIKELESEVRMLKQVVMDQQRQYRQLPQSTYSRIGGSNRS